MFPLSFLCKSGCLLAYRTNLLGTHMAHGGQRVADGIRHMVIIIIIAEDHFYAIREMTVSPLHLIGPKAEACQ